MNEIKLLRSSRLTKTFKQGQAKVTAVRSVDFDVNEGERVYIHGPSGAGKSTLLDMLGGISRPTGGVVEYRGRSVYKMSDRARSFVRNRSFGFVFQFYHLLPELNVMENVLLPARISGDWSRKSRDRALGLLDKVGMKHRLKHRPSAISGGEAQRVAVARALINSPEILFCDEPTGNLDTAMSDTVCRLLFEISEENDMSLVIVSHKDIDEKMFHTRYRMKDGELELSLQEEYAA